MLAVAAARANMIAEMNGMLGISFVLASRFFDYLFQVTTKAVAMKDQWKHTPLVLLKNIACCCGLVACRRGG
jgi:hypothetical protein